MREQAYQIAQTLATTLVRTDVDHNEVAKASTYLNQTRDAGAFFTWLDWMANPRVSTKLARSRRTPEYYVEIRKACQNLRAIDDVDEMALTLGWAVRLMRYVPYARPVDPTTLMATSPAESGQRPMSPQKDTRSQGTRAGSGPSRINDLRPGMELAGTVKRIEKYGAFVDVGVGRDGLVHVSKVKQGYVESVKDVVEQGQRVTVWVEEVDPGRGRISLTMIRPAVVESPLPQPTLKPVPPKEPAKAEPPPRPAAVRVTSVSQVKEGMWLKGTVQAVDHNRIAVNVGLGEAASLMFEYLPGQPTDQFDVEDAYPVGMEIEAEVRRINKKGRIQLTLIG